MLAQLFVTSLSFMFSGPIAQAQPQPSNDVKASTDTPDSKEEIEAQRAKRRQRWQRYREATPQQRLKMRTERMVEMASQTYELDDMQKEIVRSEIVSIQQERRLAMGDKATDYDKLRNEMFNYWTRRREQADKASDRRSFWRQARDDPQFKHLREQMRKIDREYPFNWQESLKRIEALLPDDQAEKGRKRLEERFSRRRGSWGRRRDASRERTASDESKSRKAGKSTGGQTSEDPKTLQEAAANKDGPSDRPARANDTSHRIPQHPWEKYVQAFIGKYELTPAQTAAARSILKNELSRARPIERAIETQIEKAKQLKDLVKREKRLAALHKPVEQLFSELKGRLDGLLTENQRVNNSN